MRDRAPPEQQIAWTQPLRNETLLSSVNPFRGRCGLAGKRVAAVHEMFHRSGKAMQPFRNRGSQTQSKVAARFRVGRRSRLRTNQQVRPEVREHGPLACWFWRPAKTGFGGIVRGYALPFLLLGLGMSERSAMLKRVPKSVLASHRDQQVSGLRFLEKTCRPSRLSIQRQTSRRFHQRDGFWPNDGEDREDRARVSLVPS
jgi:hypothetical protein